MKYTSAILTAARGKVRGLVASHNKGGTYFRGKTIPTNPKSAGQVAARGRVGNLMARWRSTVVASNQAGWATFAMNVNVIDKLGNSILLSGPNWYMKANAQRMAMGLPVVDAAPGIFALSTLSPLSGTLVAAGATALIGWNGIDDWQTGSVTAGIAIYASRPQNSTINYFSGPYRFAGTVRSAASSGTLAVPLPFLAGPTGSKIFFRAVASASDARPSSVFRFSVNVP